MFIIQCPILWYAKVCALPSAHSSLSCIPPLTSSTQLGDPKTLQASWLTTWHSYTEWVSPRGGFGFFYFYYLKLWEADISFKNISHQTNSRAVHLLSPLTWHPSERNGCWRQMTAAESDESTVFENQQNFLKPATSDVLHQFTDMLHGALCESRRVDQWDLSSSGIITFLIWWHI